TLFGVTVSYNTSGSLSGAQQLSSGAVDFGATDAPLTSTEAQSCHGCLLLPWALTAIAVGYNVPGAGSQLKLSSHVLSEIYLGQITHWNDAQLKALNPGVSLPNLRITPVYQPSSGDTYAFTSYLSKTDSGWRSKVGAGISVSFPTGVHDQGNTAAEQTLQSTSGAIAYVGAAYLIAHGLP